LGILRFFIEYKEIGFEWCLAAICPIGSVQLLSYSFLLTDECGLFLLEHKIALARF
jgi:hypothetical protein